MDSSQRGTNIHRGVDEGFDILKSADNIGTGDFKHVPALVLLSDGAASAAGAGDWWNPNSNRDGNGKSYSMKYDFKTIMNAQYNKQQVNLHYGLDSNSDNACKVYTIGMGLDSLTTGNDGYGRNPKGHAQITLDPGTYIYDNNDVANAIQNAWEQYNRGYWNEPTLDGYTFEHPNNNDITTIEYNDGYYAAENADDVADVFDDITSDITSSVASVPTQTTGNVYESGWLEYVDPLGDYMQIGEFKELVYGNQVFRLDHSDIGEDGTSTYVFSGELDNGSGIYNNVDVNNIDITVSKEENANNQIVTIRIPAALIPVRVNNVDTDIDGTVTNNNNGAKPIRLVYSVKTSDTVLNENGTLKKSSISDAYIADNKNEDGTIKLYSNSFEKQGSGVNPAYGARVTFTPAQNNPYYFLQEDTLIYSAQNDNSVATYAEYFRADDNAVFYIRSEYYEGTQLKVNWIERTKAQFEGHVQQNGEGKAFIERGTTRVGNLTDLQLTKTQNSSQTSDYYFYPVENGDGSFTVYLGNNGVITKELSTSLSVAKIVEAKEGFTLPEANATFTFNVSADDFKQIEDGKTVKATRITTIEGQDPVSEEVDYVVNKGTAAVTLEKNQKVIFDNLKQGTNYKVEEVDNPAGYTFKKVTVNGVDNDSAIVAGTLTVDDNHDSTDLVYTNEYGASPITVDPTNLELGGTKEITGRNFENGDNFTFVLRGANNAPMPDGVDAGQDAVITLSTDNGGLTTGEAEASFKFTGNIQYDHPGTYQYYLVERNPYNNNETPISGINYDSTRYRLDVIVDLGDDGNLQESHKWYKAVNQNGTYEYVEMQAPVEIRFTNDFSANSAEVTFTGEKDYNKTLTDGMFSYRLTGIDNAPMPEGTIGNFIDTTVDADGSIEFGAIEFTDTMIGNTYTYTVEEILPDGVDSQNPTKDGITYDTTIKTISVTVGHDGAQVTAQTNGNGFEFVNKYRASKTVALTGTKTITGREFKNGDSFKFTVTAKGNAPQPTNSEVTINPTSGTEANISFGDITFTNSGQFEYEIKEEQVNTNGITSDPNTVIVTYNVTDNGNGTLNAVATYTKNGQPVQGVEFVNTYAASSVTSDNIEVQKTFTGLPNKWRPTDFFGYTISGQEGAPLPERTTIYIGQKINEDGTVSDQNTNNFGTIGFTQAGEYSYQIKEIQGNIQGVTYDEHTTELKIKVIDDLNGRLVIDSITYDNSQSSNSADQTVVDKATFTNTYSAGAVTFENFNVQKTIDGREWLDGETYSFTLSKVDRTESGEKNLTDIETIEIGAPEAGVSNTSKFSPVTIDAVGSYEYEIREDIPSDAINGVKNGITYDTHVYTVKFDVYDPGNGTLAVRNVTYDGDANINTASFTNAYKANGSTSVSVTKNLTGRDWMNEDSFDFTLEIDKTHEATLNAFENNQISIDGANDEGVANISISSADESKTKAFGNINFNDVEDGEYRFIVKETPVNDEYYLNGIKYSKAEYLVTITVNDNGSGTLGLTSLITQQFNDDGDAGKGTDFQTAEFTNRYDASASVGVPTGFTLTKIFEGHDWTDAYSFQFKLNPVDGAPMPQADENNGVTIDAEGNAIKTVVGPQESGSTDFDFGSIEYTQAGTYKYTVSEIKGDNPGITYDTHEATVTVTVTDKDDQGSSTGQLVASASVVDGEFKNTYETGEVNYDAQAGLKIVKNMTGSEIATGQFIFTMSGKDSDSSARLNGGQALAVNTDGALLDGNIASETIKLSTGLVFTKDDVGKTYTYTVKENIPEEAIINNNVLNGVTYDSHEYEVKFVVTEDGEGTLNVETFVDGVSQGITSGEISTNALPVQLVFNNSYDAGSTTVGGEGSVSINAKKVLENDDIANYNGAFKFNVVSHTNGALVSSGTNDANGTITFSPINYTTKNLNEAITSGGSNEVGKAILSHDENGNDVYTFEYTVSEDDSSLPAGITMASGVFQITVTVTDDNQGNISAAVSYTGGATGITFVNTYGYGESTQVTLSGNKTVTAEDRLTPPTLNGGEYQFTIEGSEGAPMPATTTVSNNGSSIAFDPITYTMENVFGNATVNTDSEETSDEVVEGETPEEEVEVQTAGRTKQFVYTITETGGSLPGVTNDTTSKVVTVTVTDNGDGTISTDVTEDANAVEGNDFTFVNTYSIDKPIDTTPTDGSVTIKKELEGQTLDADEFTFQMKDLDGNVVSEAKNNAEGNVTFGTIRFDNPGTYKYTITELNGGLNGFTYDESIYYATVKVTDNGDGSLSAEWTIENDAQEAIDSITFKNKYEAYPTVIQIGASKILNGKDLTDGEFTFQLIDENGDVVSEVKNNGIGSIQFDKIKYEKEGTYNYTLKEVNDNQNGITYDDTVYNVQVTVKDDQQGHLTVGTDGVVVTNDEGEVVHEIVFTNEYKEDPKGEDTSEKTDGSNTSTQTYAGLFTSLAVDAAALAGIATLLKKRNAKK